MDDPLSRGLRAVMASLLFQHARNNHPEKEAIVESVDLAERILVEIEKRDAPKYVDMAERMRSTKIL